MNDEDVGEELAYRVVTAAHRRRMRLLVVTGLIAVTLSGGVAVALTHRSGADPGRVIATTQASGTPADAAAARHEIYAIARARYPVHSANPRCRVTFGPLVLRGDHARLPVSEICGPLNGEGYELIFDRIDGQWFVTDVRDTWIS